MNTDLKLPQGLPPSLGKRFENACSLKLFLLSHGETEWTFTGRHAGLTDLPLTALGEDEAREWAPCLHDIPFSRIITSPRQHARRTCELAGLGEASEMEEDLAEWDLGAYEGLDSAEIRENQPDWHLFRDGSPNGESPLEITARADRIIAHLRSMTGNLALFSHRQFGSVLAARWIGLSVAKARHFPFETASLGILGYHSHHPEVPVIELWNSAPHEVSCLALGSHFVDQMPLRLRAIQRWEDEGGGLTRDRS